MLVEGHPLHLSITNITIADEKMTVSIKTFRDDWEVAYFHYHSRPIDFSDPVNRNKPWFRKYLAESFRISSGPDDEPAKLAMDTILLNDDQMQIEMHAGMKEKPKSLYLYNTILTDIFPDQTNLVIIGYEGKETGIKFDIKKHAEELRLKD
jgi:hypothetical protein